MSEPEDYGWIVVAALATFAIWLPHLFYSVRWWLRDRTPRSFRNAYIAGMLQIGLLRIVLGSSSRNWPEAEFLNVLNLWTAPLLTAALISGAFVALWSWHQGDDRRW